MYIQKLKRKNCYKKIKFIKEVDHNHLGNELETEICIASIE